MNLFKRLFGKSSPDVGGKIDLTEEQFFQRPDIARLITQYRKTTTLLRPHLAVAPLPANSSKFGGDFDGSLLAEYPRCKACQTPLNFVLQLYRKDFPDFYFPGNADLFQLFRCPNDDCPDAFSEQYDHVMHPFFGKADPAGSRRWIRPSMTGENLEPAIPDCRLQPEQVEDFPNYDDFDGDDFVNIERTYGNDWAEVFMATCASIQRTKFGGYPSFTQSPVYPVCTCGKTKTFFFQLSSEDPEDGVESPPPPDQWNPLGIMIGDVGNIYFYVCKRCGVETVESNWDCY